ncbi:MAG TPA: GDSL-type esterase/lipase family protein [Planctomycetota bacterium]|nr:GDSL-type esterase/lipase family protein [Planctomycetota bacterium]
MVRRAPSGAVRAAFACAALLMGLGLAEGLARWRWPGVEPRPETHGVLLRRSDDPRLRTELIPLAEEKLIFRDAQGRSREVLHRVNSQGWRGPERSEARTEGLLRIACLGDSHTFGHGVQDGETWPAVLERELGARGVRSEALNFGVGGFDTEQELRLLETRALAFAPDLVLLEVFANDALFPDFDYAKLAPRTPFLGRLDRDSGSWVAWLRRRSRLADLAAESLQRRMGSRAFLGACAATFAEGHPGRRRVESALRAARERSAERGARFAVIFYPLLVRDGRHLASHEIGADLGEFCRAEKIPFLDLEPVFLAHDVDRLRIHALDYHAGREAQALAGTEIAAFVLRNGLLADLGGD